MKKLCHVSFFQEKAGWEGYLFFPKKFVLRYENSVSRKKVYGGSLLWWKIGCTQKPDWLEKQYFSIACMYAEQVEKSEKTIRGSITENHVYIGRSTWVAGQASIRARINSSEKV